MPRRLMISCTEAGVASDKKHVAYVSAIELLVFHNTIKGAARQLPYEHIPILTPNLINSLRWDANPNWAQAEKQYPTSTE